MSPAVQMNRAIFPQHVSASSDLLEALFPPPVFTAARRRIVPGRVQLRSDFNLQNKTRQRVAPNGRSTLSEGTVPAICLKPAAAPSLRWVSPFRLALDVAGCLHC